MKIDWLVTALIFGAVAVFMLTLFWILEGTM